MLCSRGEKQVASVLRSASQSSERRGALIAFHMEIKTKRRGNSPSLIHRKLPTCSESPAVCCIVFLGLRPLRRKKKTNSFSQFQPTGIRLSTSVFVKLKGLYSQWRAARRNFPLLVFPLISLASDLGRIKVGCIITPVLNTRYVDVRAQRAGENRHKTRFCGGDSFA